MVGEPRCQRGDEDPPHALILPPFCGRTRVGWPPERVQPVRSGIPVVDGMVGDCLPRPPLSVGVNRCIAVSAVAVVALLAAACSSGPNLTADRAAVAQAQHAVNTDRAELDRLQEEST